MKKLVVLLISVLTLSGCNAQSNDTKSDNKSTEPKVDYKVNKKYDDDGNLIAYDSTYTYYYSNIDQDAMTKDSIFQKFNNHFIKSNPFEDDKFFEDFFMQNSYSKDEFFKDNFFRESFKKNNELMDEMMRRMDEMKNEFLMKQYPLKEDDEHEKDKI